MESQDSGNREKPGFDLFPSRRMDRAYPGWVWFAGISAVTGGIIAGAVTLYLVGIDFHVGIILFYATLSLLLPISGHGVLNFRVWGKIALMVLSASTVLVTFASGIHGFAFADVTASPRETRGMLDWVVVYGWMASNLYVLLRLLLDRGKASLFHAAVSNSPRQGTRIRGPVYYYVFLALWYGLIGVALLDHLNLLSLPLASLE